MKPSFERVEKVTELATPTQTLLKGGQQLVNK
jgi:hypothetical protein